MNGDLAENRYAVRRETQNFPAIGKLDIVLKKLDIGLGQNVDIR